MHIFLYGPPGTGKSTIGKKLARQLAVPFIDLDHVIESEAAMSIAEIMAQRGEAAFRDMETSALKTTVGHAFAKHPEVKQRGSVTDSVDKVIALGGGALLRDENRHVAETHGTVVLLTAELSTLLFRLKHDSGKRPLLAGDVREKLTALLDQRKQHYSSFAIQMNVDGKGSEQTVIEIQNKLGRFHLSAMGEYDAMVASVRHTGRLLHEHNLQNPVLVTDENVARLHLEQVLASLQQAGYESKVLVMPAGEAYKNLETVQRLWQGFLEHGLDRKSTIIALGGGVIGDLTGFAASTYMRGVSWVCMPTTLLSMVDASLGGKTGFDLPQGKNLIGSFYPPKLVLADPQVLKTLPEPEFLSGLAEVVKHGIIADPELFHSCECGVDYVTQNLEDIVKRAMAVKIRIIEEDPYERGRRAALNLGHTVGHAVELASKFQLRHGEAIAIGMVAEAQLAERLAVAPQGLSDRIRGVLLKLGLPVQIPTDLSRDEILQAMRVDKKKNATSIRFALPAAIGRVELVDVSDLEVVLQEPGVER